LVALGVLVGLGLLLGSGFGIGATLVGPGFGASTSDWTAMSHDVIPGAETFPTQATETLTVVGFRSPHTIVIICDWLLRGRLGLGALVAIVGWPALG